MSVSKFVEIVVAKLTGDKAKETAIRNEKLAKAAIKGQISALEAKLVKDELALEQAEEALEEAIYPSDLIKDAEAYIRGIKVASDYVDELKAVVDATQDSIDYFNSLVAVKF